MLTNLDLPINNMPKRVISPLPMSAVYNKQQFIAQFVSLHHQSTQPTLVNQILTAHMPGVHSEYWILYDDNHQPIACAGANTVMSDASVGYVGLFEAKNEHAGTAVLNAATAWLRQGGLRQFAPVRQILGPVNLTTWLQYRLRVDTDEQPSMSFEPRHPAFYQACFAQAGFVKAVDYYTTFFDIHPMTEGYRNYTRGLTLNQLHFDMQYWNTLDFEASLTPEKHPNLTSQDDVAKRIYDLSIDLFRGKELFDESMPRENHRHMVLSDMVSRPEVDNASLLDLSSFVVDRTTGEDVGYIAAWVENHDTLVIKTVGFIPRLRKTKVFAISLLETLMRAKDHWGCSKAACALMNENSAGLSERVAGKSVRHVYRLYVHNPNAVVNSQLTGQPQQEGDHITQDLCSQQDRGHSETTPIKRTLLVSKLSATSTEHIHDHLQRRQQNFSSRVYWGQQRATHLGLGARERPLSRL
ncbi:hypothetical protein BGZ68_009614 [Mortierella alpina]|nr:hypothetical protein BGZ68_009614 [Mortierella alpina]